MNETYNETMEFLYNINDQDVIGKEAYESYISDNSNFDINDFVSNVYVPDSFLEYRTLFAIKHYLYSLPNYHTQNFLLFNCVLEGEFEHIVEGVSFRMKKGDISLVRPNVYHSMDIAEKKEPERHKSVMVSIMVRPEAAAELFSEATEKNEQLGKFINAAINGENGRKYVLFSCNGEHGVYKNLIQLIYYEARNNYIAWENANEAVIQNLFRTLVSELVLSGNFSVNYSTEFAGNSSTVDIVKYIHDNYKTVTLQSVARQFNYCTAYTSRLIKKRTGLGFATLVSEIRLANALSLMMETELKISDIAESCGYGSPEHFFRTFKEKYGQTPTELRKNQKAKTDSDEELI